MRWNLRLAAANRGIWKASELQHLLADHGLVISAGKMSPLGAGPPAPRKLDDPGMTYCQGVCLACYNFAARYRSHAGECAACRRRLPLKGGYCRLCWCQARDDRAAADTDARSAVVLAPHLALVRHHQLFFARMDD